MKIFSVEIFLYKYEEGLVEWGTQNNLVPLIDDEQGNGV